MTAETPAATATATPSASTTETPTATATDATTLSSSDGKTATTDTSTTTTTDDKTTTDEKPGDDKPKEGEEGAPETYAAFTMPEGVEIDQAAIDTYAPIFKELGLTQAQAQRLVDLRAAEVQAMGEGSAEKAEAWRAQRNAEETATNAAQWLDATKADKEIGGANFDPVKTRVIEAIGVVGTQEMRQAFDSFGWGNHPELVRLVNRLIDYTPQDRGERAAGAGGTKSAAAVLFDHPTSQPR